MKKIYFLINILLFIIGGNVSAASYTIEAESMTRAGQHAGLITSPFNGLALYGNGDRGTASQVFADGAGIYRISVTGASNNTTTAGVSLYIGGEWTTNTVVGGVKKAFSFTATTATTATAEIKLSDISSTDPTSVILLLETDNGSNDTYIDKIVIEFLGAIVIKPAPTLPEQGAFYTDVYRNMFLEAGYSQEAIDNKLEAIWQHFFYGGDNEKLYYEVEEDEAYILDVNNNDVRSEGMSYGMMICVQMNKQTEFNRLWKWAKTHMQYTSGNFEGYFAWQLNTNGSIKGNGPASDGEEYFVMALMFAAHRWGNGAGIYNYDHEANEILRHCMRRGDSGGGVVNLFNTTEKQVVFVPYGNAASFTDPSYHLPAFYQLWSEWATDTSKRTFWAEVATKSRAMWPLFAHASTGLMPDYAEFSGAPHNGDGDHKGFYYDAWRCTMNMAMDYAWFNNTGNTLAGEQTIVNRIHNFFNTKGIDSYGSLYNLDGTVYQNNTDHSPGLVACNAAGALASNQSMVWDFVDDFFTMYIPSGTYRYYDGMLYFMNYLHLSGNFKIYKPIPSASNATLQSLSISAAGTMKPAFSSGVTEYEIKVANSVENIDIDFSPTNLNATVTVVKLPPVELQADLRSTSFPLADGNNVFEITVESSDQSQIIVYTLTVIRLTAEEEAGGGDGGTGDGGGSSGGGDDCDIVFDFETPPDGNIFTYSVVKDNGNTSSAIPATITAAPDNANTDNQAILFSNTGSGYGDGSGKLMITLPAGKTLADYESLSFDIYLPSTGDQKDKTIKYAINTAASSGSTLVSTSGSTNLDQWLKKTIGLTSLPTSATSFYISIGGANWSGSAKFYIDNVSLISKPESCALADPQTDATLATLSVNQGTLTPAFSKSTTNYTVSVANDIENITISATASQAGTGSSAVSGAGAKPLQVGANTFNIVVTAPNGTTKKTYTIVVTRADEVVSCDIVFDFETNEINDAVTYFTNSSRLTSATVLANPTSANEKSLKIVVSGYGDNTYVLFPIQLPGGKTTLLNNYSSIEFDLYAASTQYSKNIVIGGNSTTNYSVGTAATIPAGWTHYTKTIDQALLTTIGDANASGNFNLKIGVRDNGNAAYYIDNIKLVAKEGTCPRTYTWTPTAGSTDWTSEGNWIPSGTPGASDKVIIPKASSYPAIPVATTVKSITFRSGAEIDNQHNLTYEKAFVEYDFSASGLSRGRWHMLSLPLQEAYPGDFTFGGYPVVWLRKFNVVSNMANWETVYASQTPLTAGTGFIYWLDDEDNDMDNRGLTLSSGILRLPFFDSDASGVHPDVHYQHDFTGGASTFFNYQTGSDKAYERSSQHYNITRTDNAYKLAGETADVSLNFAGEEGRASEMTVVGNPFMATLSFTDLYDANLNTIKNGYQIWTGDYENAGYKGYNTTGGGFGLVTTDDLDEFIAPMQAFIVEKNDSYSSGDLAFNVNMTNAAAASELRSSTVESGKKITLTAANSAGAYRTVITEREEGSELLSNLDSRILMNSVGNLPVIYSIKPSENGAAYLGANMLPAGDREIPIGLWTNYSGELNLTFAGMDSYNTGITFVDQVTGEETDLTGRSSYTCTVAIAPETANGQALALNDRFVLRLAQVTQPTDLPVVNNSLIGQASVYNLQGQLLHRIPASKLYNLPAGIYLVRLTNGTEVKTVKMILSNKH